MLDDLLEWVLGVILEGASEAAGSQRFPMPVRVLLASISGLPDCCLGLELSLKAQGL